MDNAILFGIRDHHLRLRECHALRVQDFVGLPFESRITKASNGSRRMNSRINSIVVATSLQNEHLFMLLKPPEVVNRLDAA